jgi:hypothetical protein
MNCKTVSISRPVIGPKYRETLHRVYTNTNMFKESLIPEMTVSRDLHVERQAHRHLAHAEGKG